MAQNPGRAPFDEDEIHTPLRRPHVQVQSTKALSPILSKLSTSAPEFIPKAKIESLVHQSPITIPPPLPYRPLNGISVQNRLNINKSIIETSPKISSPPTTIAPTLLNPYQHNNGYPLPSFTPNSSVQNRLNKHNNVDDAIITTTTTTDNCSSQQSNLPSNTHLTTESEVEMIELKYLRTVIEGLNNNPASFDRVATRFLQIFEGLENNHYILTNTMEEIFNESISNPNFRYMGAKLYNLLHMLNLRRDSLFYTLLECKLNFHQTEVMEFMENDEQHKVRETALFLAELYMQLRGDDLRISLIAENIVFSLKQLLSKSSSDNIRCVCLTLKLAGYDLDTDCPNDIKFITDELYRLNSKNPFIYPLITNIMNMQQNNWGRSISESSESIGSTTTTTTTTQRKFNDNNHLNVETTLYGPDGQILTEEENKFLSSASLMNNNAIQFQQHNNSYGDLDDIDSDIDFDPEMDEEAENAYRTFCKLSISNASKT